MLVMVPILNLSLFPDGGNSRRLRKHPRSGWSEHRSDCSTSHLYIMYKFVDVYNNVYVPILHGTDVDLVDTN